MIKSSVLFEASRPISVRFSNQIFYDKETKEQPLIISITDVYGKQILASNDATNVQIKSAKESSIKKEGPTMMEANIFMNLGMKYYVNLHVN